MGETSVPAVGPACVFELGDEGKFAVKGEYVIGGSHGTMPRVPYGLINGVFPRLRSTRRRTRNMATITMTARATPPTTLPAITPAWFVLC